MSSTPTGLTRRRGAGGGASNDNDDGVKSPPPQKPNDSRTPETSYESSANGHKIAYDPRDISESAERIKQPKLTLMEEVLLMGLKDKQGLLSFWNDNISYALRGCIVLELAFRGRIAMTKDPARRRYPLADRTVEVVDDTLTGEVLLDEALKMMKSSEKMSVSSWIDLMSGETWNFMKIGYQLKQVRERLQKGLVDKGILRTEKRNFLLFDMATHPVADGGAKDELRRRVRNILTNRTVILPASQFLPQEVELRYLRTITMVCAAYAANVLENALATLGHEARERAFAQVDELLAEYSQWPFGKRAGASQGIGANLGQVVTEEVGSDKELQMEVVMSFGFSVGDFIAVAKLGRSVYKRCRDSPGQYQALASDASQLSNVLEDLEDLLKEAHFDPSFQKKILARGQPCKDVLIDMNRLLDQYQEMSLKHKSVKDRIMWDEQQTRDIRERMTSTTVGLLTLYHSLHRSQLMQLQRTVQTMAQEFKAGNLDSDSFSTFSVGDYDDGTIDDAWEKLRSDLEARGFLHDMIEENRSLIVEAVINAVNSSGMTKQAPNGTCQPHNDTPSLPTTGTQQSAEAVFHAALDEERLANVSPVRAHRIERLVETWNCQDWHAFQAVMAPFISELVCARSAEKLLLPLRRARHLQALAFSYAGNYSMAKGVLAINLSSAIEEEPQREWHLDPVSVSYVSEGMLLAQTCIAMDELDNAIVALAIAIKHSGCWACFEESSRDGRSVRENDLSLKCVQMVVFMLEHFTRYSASESIKVRTCRCVQGSDLWLKDSTLEELIYQALAHSSRRLHLIARLAPQTSAIKSARFGIDAEMFYSGLPHGFPEILGRCDVFFAEHSALMLLKLGTESLYSRRTIDPDDLLIPSNPTFAYVRCTVDEARARLGLVFSGRKFSGRKFGDVISASSRTLQTEMKYGKATYLPRGDVGLLPLYLKVGCLAITTRACIRLTSSIAKDETVRTRVSLDTDFPYTSRYFPAPLERGGCGAAVYGSYVYRLYTRRIGEVLETRIIEALS
ncbi:MAG: hypothetical protein M1828_003685 [Chrysothrix sp. TS-e1954]|nr:MAG: hypothetical protein M1828_003685 [Chrysothrix sp. TS-e1954]